MSTDQPGPFDIPAAWVGDELFSRPDWTHEFTSAPEHLRAIQHNLEHGSGAHLMRGSRIEEKNAHDVFLSIASQIGTPVSQSASGERVLSVRDEGYRVGQSQARGPNTRKRLSFHTDRCDVIAFMCLRQARSGGENQLVSSVTLFNQMREHRPDLLRVLMCPFYFQRHNVDTGNERPWVQQPIFSVHEGHFAASYLRVLLDRAYAMPELPDLTSEQIEALAYLESLAADPRLHVTFRLEEGDILFLNNWVTFHRREEFEDHDDSAARRHLLRIWLSVPNSRPLAPDFEANYGSTQAGAVRGGIHPPKGTPPNGNVNMERMPSG